MNYVLYDIFDENVKPFHLVLSNGNAIIINTNHDTFKKYSSVPASKCIFTSISPIIRPKFCMYCKECILMHFFKKGDISTCIDLLNTKECTGLFSKHVLYHAFMILVEDKSPTLFRPWWSFAPNFFEKCNDYELKCLIDILLENKGSTNFIYHLFDDSNLNTGQIKCIFKILIGKYSIEHVLENFFNFEYLPTEFCEYLLVEKYITSDIKFRQNDSTIGELSLSAAYFIDDEYFKLYLKYIPLSIQTYNTFLEKRNWELNGVDLENDEIYSLLKYYKSVAEQKQQIGYKVKGL